MAMIGRKEKPTPSPTSTTQPRDQVKARTVPAPGGGNDNTRVGRMQGRIANIIAELRKVTWPTREETRNLTIVVIGISAAVGALLAVLDVVFSFIYSSIGGITF
ncbi:MAG TPA: preprotein translocase subunit SecE [Chloroflexia bacterium]|nr:preprotein translocase subunit SecE [Chloroflexia bacterium]